MDAMDELAKHYATEADEELVRLAEESADLTPAAREMLQAELARRGIDVEEYRRASRSSDHVDAFENKLTPRDWQRYRRRVGRWPVLSILGYILSSIVGLTTVGSIVVIGAEGRWSKPKIYGLLALWVIIWTSVSERVRRAVWLKELRDHQKRKN
jgi:hypothetical protein